MTPTLATDAYKFSMAQAGFPLRVETFYFSFRRGGVQSVPWDLVEVVGSLVDGLAIGDAERTFARRADYGMTAAMEVALSGGRSSLRVVAVPKGCWVLEREPILSVTGPSFLVSWLEPMLLWLNYPIQLATELARTQPPPRMLVATCDEHEQIIERIAADVAVRIPPVVREDAAYEQRVRETVRQLVEAVGTSERVFEVGMRSAVCMGQHRTALRACAAEGVTRTGNLHLAHELGLTPVGSMGHEHVQRWGADLPAFEAMRDMRVAAPSYLLDTFDTMSSGITAAVEVMRGRPHECSIRYDSGNKYIQYLHACELLSELGFEPTHLLEDALDVASTRHFEQLRGFTGWPAEKQIYGYGGCIVTDPVRQPLHRDRVSAVFKLSETGGTPCMKFANEAGLGKQSVPGRPVVWRRLRGSGPLGIIGQQDEPVPDDYCLLSGNADARERLRLCNLDGLARALVIPAEQHVVGRSAETIRLEAEVRAAATALRDFGR